MKVYLKRSELLKIQKQKIKEYEGYFKLKNYGITKELEVRIKE